MLYAFDGEIVEHLDTGIERQTMHLPVQSILMGYLLYFVCSHAESVFSWALTLGGWVGEGENWEKKRRYKQICSSKFSWMTQLDSSLIFNLAHVQESNNSKVALVLQLIRKTKMEDYFSNERTPSYIQNR